MPMFSKGEGEDWEMRTVLSENKWRSKWMWAEQCSTDLNSNSKQCSRRFKALCVKCSSNSRGNLNYFRVNCTRLQLCSKGHMYMMIW